MRYYEVNKETSQKIKALLEERKEMINRAKKVGKSLGATDVYFINTSFGETVASGFAFDKPPDTKLWKKLKNTTKGNGYAPKRIKSAQWIRDKMKGLSSNAISDCCELIGLGMDNRFINTTIWNPGFVYRDNWNVFVSIPDYAETTPTNCTRISDLEYERIVKE